VAPVQEAGEWPMTMGGPLRAGYADESVPVAVEVAWREGVGRGIAAPLLLAGDVLLATTTSRGLVSMNAETGGKYWDRRFSGAFAGSAVRRGRIAFVATRDREQRTFAIDLERGRRVWSRRIGAARAEPVLAGQRVIVATEAREVVALDAAGGEVVWRTRLGAAAAVAPVPFDDDVFVVTTADSVYRLDGANGRITARGSLPATPAAPLVLRRDTLIAALHSGEVAALHVEEMKVAWTATVDAPILAPPAVADDGAVYVLTRDASVWRISGARDVRRIAALGGAATGAFTLARGGLLVGRLDGTLFLLDLEGNIIWQMDLGDSIVAPVSVYGGAVYVPLLHGDIVKLQ